MVDSLSFVAAPRLVVDIDAISRDASGPERESNIVSMTFDFVWLDL